MEILKDRTIAIVVAILFFVIPQLIGQEIKFKLGNSNNNGHVKSVSTFEYDDLKGENTIISKSKTPKKYEKFNEKGKLIYRIQNLESNFYITQNSYDELGNILYKIKYKAPDFKDWDSFIEKNYIFKENELLMDSLTSNGYSGKEYDFFLDVERYYYDMEARSVTSVSKNTLQTTIWHLDKQGNIIFEKKFSNRSNSYVKNVVSRKYVDNKIFYEETTTGESKIFKQFLYDANGKISNQMIFNEQAGLLRHHIYTYSENKETTKIFGKENKLISEMHKEISLNTTSYKFYSIDETGKANLVKKEVHYKDRYDNIIKRKTENTDFNRVYVTEYVFEYY